MRPRTLPWAALFLSCNLFAAATPDDAPSTDTAKISTTLALDDFLILPLHVHLLEAPDDPDLHCRLTDADIHRVIKKVNTIYRPAAIHFELQPLLREPAANLDRFRTLMKLQGEAAQLERFRDVRPEASRNLVGLHVYYIHQFEVNGVYLGNNIAFVKDSASLRKVPRGIDEPLPRVTAHELGHALGLPHRQNRTNLLASGTTGISLNDEEIATVRSFALHKPGVNTIQALRDLAHQAQTEGDQNEADRLARVLGELSSSSPTVEQP